MDTQQITLHDPPADLLDAVVDTGFRVAPDAWIHLYTGPLPEARGVHIAVVSTAEQALLALNSGADDALIWPAELVELALKLQSASRSAARWRDLEIYRGVYRQSSAWLELTDTDIRITDVSEGFEAATGFTRDEAIGRTPAELFRGRTHSPEYYQTIQSTLTERGRWRGDLLSRRKDGSLAVVDTQVSMVRAGEHALAHHAVKTQTGATGFGRLHNWVEQRATSPWLLVSPADQRVLECTKAAAQVFGLSRSTVLESDLVSLGLEVEMPGIDQQARVDRWLGDRAFQVDISVRRLGDSSLGHVVLTDITERKEASELMAALSHELTAVRDQALAADRAKTAFLASMSHELRTPLNAIIGYSELLEEGIDSTEDLADLERIRVSGLQLLSLVDEVLDLARVEAGTLQMHPTHFALRELLGEVADGVRLRAAKRGFQIEIHCEDRELYADRQRVRQVLTNLLANAVKYADPGTIVLGARGHDIWVLDEGPGLSPEQQQAIFKPFMRLQREGDGVGLGLALCRKLADALGGSLHLDSARGRGSRFTLCMP